MNEVIEHKSETQPAGVSRRRNGRGKNAATAGQGGALCAFAIGDIKEDGLPVLKQGFADEQSAIRAAYKQDTQYFKIERYVAKEKEQDDSTAVMLVGVKAD